MITPAAKEDLEQIIEAIHIDCFRLCKVILGEYLPVVGNVAIFCQSNDDYERLTHLTQKLTCLSTNPQQKYLELIEPIVVPASDNLPGADYAYLYVRKPAIDSPEQGDIDFILTLGDFERLKLRVAAGKVEGASIYDRPGWDMVELRDPSIAAIAYVSYEAMAVKARIKFD